MIMCTGRGSVRLASHRPPRLVVRAKPAVASHADTMMDYPQVLPTASLFPVTTTIRALDRILYPVTPSRPKQRPQEQTAQYAHATLLSRSP